METTALETLGRRIMVCGPSNSGKSTLAVAIGNRTGLPVAHLDLMRHLPHTDWVQRPDAEFHAMHEAAIAEPEWVMDGNYSKLMPQRIARATGIILLGDNRWATLARYFRRTLFERARFGALAGQKDSIKWDMIHWIVVASPPNLARYRAELPQAGLPFVEARGIAGLNRLYRIWRLERPRPGVSART